MARIRCALYTRKSSEEGLDQNFNSLHAQREACEAYVLSQAGEGWIALATAYDDGGYSGGSMERPGLKALLADIQQGLVDVVVVYKVDRLTRSLADFAKIVELFDAKGVSFVSVTQAFNTTTSMGRLTLNVLLSFAQFEREVTGERIRDKIAASRAKGLRTGARPPLGYDVKDGRLVVNPDEAERVRAIFRKYLELGSLKDLVAEAIPSKRWTGRAGAAIGGTPMTRGPLYYLLTNPAYRGITRHKDKLYPDTHPAIIEEELWDQVQAKLKASNGRQPKLALAAAGALLEGKLFDDRGNPMVQVHAKKGVRRYRYYVSRPCVTGQGESGSVKRVPAGEVERILLENVGPALLRGWRPEASEERRVAEAVVSVTLSERGLVVQLVEDAARDGGAVVRIPVTLSRRQNALLLHAENQRPSAAQTSRVLVRTLVMARAWMQELETGATSTIAAIAKREGLCEHHLARMLPLAYLAPDLVQQILEGRQPRSLTLKRLTSQALPLDWSAQRRLILAEAIRC